MAVDVSITVRNVDSRSEDAQGSKAVSKVGAGLGLWESAGSEGSDSVGDAALAATLFCMAGYTL